MNLELYAATKQKALNTLEMMQKPSKSDARGSGSLESSLKILACLLRGKLLSEVDEWPQRTVALATHHQSYKSPGDKVTLSIQIAARDNSVVQQSITSKKIEADATEALCTKPKKGSVDCVTSTIPLHGSG